MSMIRCLSVWMLAGAAAAGTAAPAQPALPAGCRPALDALEQEEASLAGSPRPPSQTDPEWRRAVRARIEPLQRRAAVACLGGASPPCRRRRGR